MDGIPNLSTFATKGNVTVSVTQLSQQEDTSLGARQAQQNFPLALDHRPLEYILNLVLIIV